MPRFITNEVGKWYPAKEKVGLRNNSDKAIVNPSATYSNYYGQTVQPGEPYIYEGPDRAALLQLWEEGVDHLGADFRNDPDLISRVKQMGFNNVTEFARVFGWDEAKAKERFNKFASVTTSHEIIDKAKAIKELGGGTDMSGSGQDVYGGFGEPPNR